MRVCLICNQTACWGKIGGFGTATRAIGAGLVRQGIDVRVVVPRRARRGQSRIEELDGMIVYGMSAWETLTSGKMYVQIDADVYHSQEPTIASWNAMKCRPDAIHVVTCRDPRGILDHLVELRYTNYKRRLIFPVTWYYEASPWVKKAVRQADAVSVPARCLKSRVRKLFGNSIEPMFLPSPFDLPEVEPEKSKDPLVLFVGRWDHRKRIERFFKLAEAFPGIRFVAIGEAHDKNYDAKLRKTYGGLKNVEMPGFLSRFDKGDLYDFYAKAWVIVNTSAREGLPITFVESAAWGCSILSGVNPDDFAERFGCFVREDDFEGGLEWLLKDDHWRYKGRAGAEYVRDTFSEANSISQHINHYHSLLSGGHIP